MGLSCVKFIYSWAHVRLNTPLFFPNYACIFFIKTDACSRVGHGLTLPPFLPSPRAHVLRNGAGPGAFPKADHIPPPNPPKYKRRSTKAVFEVFEISTQVQSREWGLIFFSVWGGGYHRLAQQLELWKPAQKNTTPTWVSIRAKRSSSFHMCSFSFETIAMCGLKEPWGSSGEMCVKLSFAPGREAEKLVGCQPAAFVPSAPSTIDLYASVSRLKTTHPPSLVCKELDGDKRGVGAWEGVYVQPGARWLAGWLVAEASPLSGGGGLPRPRVGSCRTDSPDLKQKPGPNPPNLQGRRQRPRRRLIDVERRRPTPLRFLVASPLPSPSTAWNASLWETDLSPPHLIRYEGNFIQNPAFSIFFATLVPSIPHMPFDNRTRKF